MSNQLQLLKLRKIGKVKLVAGLDYIQQLQVGLNSVNFPAVTPPPGPVIKPVKTNLDTDVVIILGAVLCVLICAVWVHAVIRCIIRRNRQVDAADTTGNGAVSNDDNSTVGLDPKTIAALPVVPVEPQAGPVNRADHDIHVDDVPGMNCNTECIVCLQEFRAGETMKLLPNCGHGFHVECIGAWLMAHSSCPICRHGVLEPPSPGSSSNSFSAGAGSGTFLLSSPMMRQMQLELSMRSLENFQQRNQRLELQRDRLRQQIINLQELQSSRTGPSSSSGSPLSSMLTVDRGLLRLFSRSNLNSNSTTSAPPQP